MIMSVFSSIVLCVLCFLLIRHESFRPPVIAALGARLFAGIAFGLIYKYYYQGGDTWAFYREASMLANHIIQEPGSAWIVLFNTSAVPELVGQLQFLNEPRSLFFSKIISVLHLLTGGNYWIITAYLGLTSLSAAVFLVHQLRKTFSGIEYAAEISFYFLPSFVFWTSGLLKESLVITAIFLSSGFAIRLAKTENSRKLLYWVSLVVSLYVLWKLKYYYALVISPMIIGLISFHYLQSWNRKLAPIAIAIVIGLGLLLSTQHYNLHPSRVLSVMHNNFELSTSTGEGDLTYFSYDGSIGSFIVNAPLALFNGLFRPLIERPSNVLFFFASVENLMVILLFLMALWKIVKRKLWAWFKNPFVLVTSSYIVILSIAIAFTTANLGTLMRYKSGYWAFFTLLLIMGLKHNKKAGNPTDPAFKK